MSLPAMLTPRRLITLLVVVLVVVGGWLYYHQSHRQSISFTADFTGTVGLYPGSDVRMLGVHAGTVDKISAHGTDVVVTMHLDHGMAAGSTTGAVILSPSLVSDRYVQLTQVWTGGPKLPDHSVIPATRTATPVELDQLYSSLTSFTDALGPNGANKNGAFSQLLNTAAANLKGNGKTFNTTLTDLSNASQTLANSKDNLFATVDNLKTFTSTLATNDTAVSGLNTQLAAVSAVLADDRQSFTAAIQQLSSALGMVQTFVSDNRAALAQDVGQLSTVTQTLADEKASLNQALVAAPQAVTNLLNAYDPTTRRLVGRGNLNEISLWAGALGAVAPTTPPIASASRIEAIPTPVPALLPSSSSSPIALGTSSPPPGASR